MAIVFYISASVAVGAALLVVTRSNAVHALLYLVASLLALALSFLALGAPFAAALEAIIYAGAIVVLFVVVIMTLNLRPQATAQENQWLAPKAWAGPAFLILILIAELIYMLASQPGQVTGNQSIDPKHVGILLLGPYVLGTELASMLLLASLVGAYHLGRHDTAQAPSVGLAAAGSDMPDQPAAEKASAAEHTGAKP